MVHVDLHPPYLIEDVEAVSLNLDEICIVVQREVLQQYTVRIVDIQNIGVSVQRHFLIGMRRH